MSTKVADRSLNVPLSRLRAWRLTIASYPLTLKVGVFILVLVALAGIFASLLTVYNPIISDFRGALLPPSAAHPFGTDNLGRDVFARVLYGTRIDLQIGGGNLLVTDGEATWTYRPSTKLYTKIAAAQTPNGQAAHLAVLDVM